MYVVSKFIMASSALEAMQSERSVAPDDCRIAPNEMQPRRQELEPAIGFATVDYEEEY